MRATPEKKQYNERISTLITQSQQDNDQPKHKRINTMLKIAADENIPQQIKFHKRDQAIEKAKSMISSREQAWKDNNRDEALELTKQ